MRSTSKNSAAALVATWNATLNAQEGKDLAFAEELFVASQTLHQFPATVSALADPTRDIESRNQLVDGIFGNTFCEETLAILRTAVQSAWSADEDLVETIEGLGVRAVLHHAGRDSRVGDVEDELHQIRRVLTQETALRVTLSAYEDYSIESREGLFEKIFPDVSAEATILCKQAIRDADIRPVTETLVRMIVLAAKISNSFAAAVWSATELSEEQEQRLERILSTMYGKNVVIHVTVDPQLIGGMRIQCGSEVIDATLLSRINNVREKIAGGVASQPHGE